MALALAMVLQATPTPAVAVTGYDSAFLFESDWLIVKPGDTGQAAVTFLNVGSVSWQKGGASQVNLATCCPLNSPPTHAAWLVTPLSSTAYATHREDLVAPGGRGTYIWNFKVPDNAAEGIYDFPGDLVLASTGEGIHREGYFHRNDNRPVAPTGAATKLELSPKTQNGVLGTNVTVTATVTGDPPAGSTTRTLIANAEVTFFVDGDSAANADFTRTATTDANGVAKIAYTRSTPGIDSIQAWVTSNPTVRDTATVQWATAAVISLTPDDAASLSLTACRTYTANVKDPNTGANKSGIVLRASLTEHQDTATANDTSATINGVAPGSGGTSGVNLTGTDSSGNASFSVCSGSTTTKQGPVTPIVWADATGQTPGGDGDNTMDASEFRDTGGEVTFDVAKAVLTLTPDTTADAATGGQRVYTIEAKDQFGNVFNGLVDVSSTELTDASTTTATDATIAWYDNDDTLRTSAGPTTGVTLAPGGCATLGFRTTCQAAQFNLNGSGKATFAITCTGTCTKNVATPIVWQDLGADDNAVQTDEPQDTGGATTFKAPAITSGRMRSEVSGATSATNPTSSENPSVNDASFGEEIYTFRLNDQSGNGVACGTTACTVQWNVRNTGSATFYIVNLDTSTGAAGGTCTSAGVTTACGDKNPAIAVAVGQTVTVTTQVAGNNVDNSTTVEIDAPLATSAEITAFLQNNASITATGTKTWIVTTAEPATGTAQGTIQGFDGSLNWYILRTATVDYFIDYLGNECFVITGTSGTETNLEDKLSVGDTVKFTNGAAGVTNACGQTNVDTHEIVTDVP